MIGGEFSGSAYASSYARGIRYTNGHSFILVIRAWMHNQEPMSVLVNECVECCVLLGEGGESTIFNTMITFEGGKLSSKYLLWIGI